MPKVISRCNMLFVGALVTAALLMIGSAFTDETVPENVVKSWKGKLTQVEVQNQGLSFVLTGEHYFYTEDDPLLRSALIAAFANDLEVRVGASDLGAKESASGTDKTIKRRKATSVAMWRN